MRAPHDLALVEPQVSLFEAFAAMSDDYRRAGETRYQHAGGWTPARFEKYLVELADNAQGLHLPPNRTPQATFWLVESGRSIVGVSRLRPILNEHLRNEGGNIGYDVPPSKRRLGFGTELLRLVLLKAAAMGLETVLVTCGKGNTGSRKVIEANGGVLAEEGLSAKDGTPLLRFWIMLAPAP